jgi:SAM-dependent methyltransferase
VKNSLLFRKTIYPGNHSLNEGKKAMLAICRKVAYSHPILYRLAVELSADQLAAKRTTEYWDRELAGPKNYYLSGTPLIRFNNSIVAQLISYGRTEPLAILDAGCGPGYLLDLLQDRMVGSYLGIDISGVAIRYATQRFSGDGEKASRARFLRSDLAAFSPEANSRFDAIVFNHVLELIDVDEAVRQVNRYYRWLRPVGRLCINAKDDPKSRFLYRMLQKDFRVTSSFLGQYGPHGLVPYRIESSPKSFPVMAAVLEKTP